MHLMLGLEKTFFETFCGIETKGRSAYFGCPFSIKKALWIEAHQEVREMQVPLSWGRRPTTRMKKGGMKATESKFFLLHLLLPILYSKNVPLKV
jgi:hypothetical protein